MRLCFLYCLFICLSHRVSQKLFFSFQWNFMENWAIGQEENDFVFVVDRVTIWTFLNLLIQYLTITIWSISTWIDYLPSVSFCALILANLYYMYLLHKDGGIYCERHWDMKQHIHAAVHCLPTLFTGVFVMSNVTHQKTCRKANLSTGNGKSPIFCGFTRIKKKKKLYIKGV